MHELKNYTVQIFKNFLKMVDFRAIYSHPMITSLLFCLNFLFSILVGWEYLDVNNFCLRNQHE
jgi:hypothetical protein